MNKHRPTRLTKAFTLLELAFSLAIIATLVAILLPKGVDALRNSRVQQVAKTVDTLKTAITSYISLPGGNGSIPRTEGTGIPCSGAALTGATDAAKGNGARLDTVMLATGMIDRPVGLRMGTQAATSTGSGNEMTWNQSLLAFVISPDAAAQRNWSGVTRVEARSSQQGLLPSVALGANFRLTLRCPYGGTGRHGWLEPGPAGRRWRGVARGQHDEQGEALMYQALNGLAATTPIVAKPTLVSRGAIRAQNTNKLARAAADQAAAEASNAAAAQSRVVAAQAAQVLQATQAATAAQALQAAQAAATQTAAAQTAVNQAAYAASTPAVARQPAYAGGSDSLAAPTSDTPATTATAATSMTPLLIVGGLLLFLLMKKR